MTPLGAVSAAPLAYQTDVLADNPFLYYRFGEASGTAADDAGAGMFDGTYVGAPTLGATGAGASGDTAATFDGSTQHVLAPAGANTFGSMLSNSSFEFVFSTLETPQDATTALFGSANTGGNTNIGIGFNERADGSARFFLRGESNVPIGGFFINEDMFDGAYHHLMFTYDSAGASAADRMKAYLDGVEQTLTFEDSSAPSSFADFQNPLAIAANNNRGTIDRFMEGTIDELAIYTTTLSATDAFNRFNALGIVVANQWNVDGGGSFNTDGNWLDNVVPTSNALFGAALSSGDAEVTLDSSVFLNSVTFNNTGNQYTLAGPNELNLTGDAQVSTTGTHAITADVAGTVGLTKVGSGTLQLTGAKSYTGVTDVQNGALLIDNLDAIDNQASGTLNIAPGATATLSAGTTGTLAAQLTGASTLADGDAALRINDAVTISRNNSSYGGVIRVDNGTLTVGNNSALGEGGDSNDRTVVQAGTTAKVALPGNVTIASELLDFEGRSTSDPGLTSSGNNAWNGVIRGEGNNTLSKLNIESTSGTLTLSQLYAQDSGTQFTYEFSGAGNTTITNRISDFDIDIGSGIIDTVNDANNVNVVKRGSGTLTIGYANADALGQDYWFGFTSILEGTLTVNSSGGTDGELRSSSIEVESGATFNVSAFTEYTQQIGQAITGAGSINVGSGNLRLIDVSNLAPGDSPGKVGELTVTSGTVTLPDLALGGGGVWSFDVGNNTDTSGDLLNVQAGSFTAGTAGVTFNITPAHGHLDAGSKTIVSHTGGANAVLNGATAQITDAGGNVLTTRQSVAINGNTAGQVNVVVTGEEESRTWNGNVSGAWDVSTSNWQGGDSQFRDLDHVTFDDSAAGTTDVTIDAPRSPGSVTFANSVPYTFSGAGGIVGSGDVNVTGSGEVTLGNTGNNFTGETTINAGGSLRMGSASTGSISNSGTLSLGVPVQTDILIQNGAATIGAGGYRVFAVEAEDFQQQENNRPERTLWSVVNVEDANMVGSSGGEALFATEAESNVNTTTDTQNYVAYNMQFEEPGTYYWFGRIVSVDGGNPGPGDDDSLFFPSNNLDASNADPTNLGTVMANGASFTNQEGNSGSGQEFIYDWFRANNLRNINVTQADVDAGTVFRFKIATREGGMAVDKHVFVADPDFGANSSFGTLTDTDLDGATAITSIQSSVTAAGSVLNVNGDFTMNSGSTLNLLINTENLHDKIVVDGVLNAGGTLNISPDSSGLGVEAGDVFDLFSFASVTGSFTIGSLPGLAAGLVWDTTQLLVTGELLVVAIDTPGDFNGDGLVDVADYTVWRDNLGAMDESSILGNGDGMNGVDTQDYLVWRNAFGTDYNAGAASVSVSVPEPGALALVGLLGLLGAAGRSRS